MIDEKMINDRRENDRREMINDRREMINDRRIVDPPSKQDEQRLCILFDASKPELCYGDANT